MTDHLIAWPLDRTHLEYVTDPAALHRRVMSYLPDLAGASPAIRSDTQTLFRVDLPSGPLGKRGCVVLRMRGDAVDATAGVTSPTPGLRDGMRITLVVAAERRNTWQGKVSVRPVTDAEAHEWAGELLRRHGFTTGQPAVSPARLFGRGRPDVHGRRTPFFWVRDITSPVTITDPDAAAAAMHNGIGRGRSYGLGLVAEVPSDETEVHVA